MNILSELTTLQDIVKANYLFTVPIYQRLYVWGDDQVKTLLADLLAAYQEKKGIYYLGGTLVVERAESDGSGRIFELIDGQQRFTTLWMMSLIWQQALQPFQYHQEKHTRPARISFSIRPEVNQFFAQEIGGSNAILAGNPQIVDALANIESFPKEQGKEFDLGGFTRFIFEKVQMVLTMVPAGTDLNKLFEVINNRGVQLQHHEILKARMLSALDDAAERERYAHLWDACSYMGSYVEKNLKEIAKLKVSTLYDNEASTKGGEMLAHAHEVLETLKNQQTDMMSEAALSLKDILASNVELQQTNDASPDEETYESDDIRSIISFPMLLQHTLRIWLHKNGQADLTKILDKELLGLFEKHFLGGGIEREAVTSFIKLLWEIRYCFDKYVIKWVANGEEEHHLICKLRLNPSTSRGKTYYSLVRQQPTTNEGFALLQSMLYHSQQITTHYWLTPLLAHLHGHPGAADQHYAYLRHLDNHMFCSIDSDSLIVRSWSFLKKPWKHSRLVDANALLAQKLGVGFPHYWFYKLEFVIWHSKQAGITDAKRNAFRLTAKNSVEHISPQQAQSIDINTVTPDMLDAFGNLSLVSRSINSEYGNKPFNEKREHFLNRNKFRLDSLKMALIYQNQEWDDTAAKEHQCQMIDLIDFYLKPPVEEDEHA